MRQNYTVLFLLLLVAQILISDFFNFFPYVTLSILPVMILCLPPSRNTTAAMFIAFASGLAVDFLAEGLPGLNALALVPVALCRNGIVRFVFGQEARDAGRDKAFFAIVLAQSLFLVIYIWADGGAAHTLVFNLIRFACSLLAGSLLSLVIANMITPGDKGRWS